MSRKVETDDDVRRFNAVFLGAPGFTLPFHVRYAAYGLGLGIFLLILLVEAITPIPVGVPPLWELCIAVLATTLLMGAVDHDRPVAAVLINAVRVAARPRGRIPTPRRHRPTLTMHTICEGDHATTNRH